ncbi:hypothetical protein NRT42_001903 [Klebsiella pneumoniae]|uniref:hypothetical protein n=1 Tax=Klebsiella pneumoniae TaxID=573 RepID=UPI000AD834B1|nr:hypothetical protein [Klebsiella pneumoniae]HDU3678035.1 hypothetical protein [Klebsiella pneumoniae subsp. ozaenae]EJG9787927.1 hypothetical protein [Klebsiella pneumoniae]EKU6508547.1 hypothetical protein [Klebsiella pneumoniae]MBD8424156.1 hypothetical protein [Klebsiella pneumoniae]MCM5961182.1 hypothetical protein [Klebsiella pneumoniae]
MRILNSMAPVLLCIALSGCAEVGGMVFPPLTATSAQNASQAALLRCARDDVAALDVNSHTLACVPAVAESELSRRDEQEAKELDEAKAKADAEAKAAKAKSDAQWRADAPKRLAASNKCKPFIYDVRNKYNFGAVARVNGTQMYNSVYSCQGWFRDKVNNAPIHFVFLQANVNNSAYEIDTIY